MGLPSRAAEALLIYLACNPRPVAREKLAELLWAERTQSQAMTNLRTILTALRRELGDFLVITRQTLAFNSESEHELDVVAFEDRLRALGLPVQVRLPLAAGRAAELRAALDLYQGDFLEGFYLREGRGFEEWAILQRERLRHLAREGLRLLTLDWIEAGQYAEAAESAARWQRVDPYSEDACRAWMWALLRSGQRNAALQVYRDLAARLTADLDVAPTAATQNLFRRIFALKLPPPLRLPVGVTVFIGREVELAELEALLSNPTTRLVTVCGPGGIGKSRLAVEAVRALAHRKPGLFLNGVYFVSLAEVDTLEAVPTRLAEALELVLEGPEPTRKQLLAYLEAREVLLVLDNFEHLLDEQGRSLTMVVELLRQAPGVKLLVTSRERLNLYEETVFDVAGLDTPAEGTADVEQSSAAALFYQCARRINRRFNPSPEEAAAVGRICRLLGGVPLAIELAAVWIRHYTPARIVGQIERDLDFLAVGYHDVPKRHRSLRAVFEHSWALLNSQEKEAFARLAVFRGGFNSEAAEAVTGGARFAGDLADKSLLQLRSEGRFDVHPLLHQFAAEKLAGLPEAVQGAAASHANFYLKFLAGQGNGETPDQRAAIRQELANIRAAWDWAACNQDLDNLESALQVWHNFFSVQSWFREGIEIFKLTVDRLEVDKRRTPEKAAVLCDLSGRLARMRIHIGEMEAARADLERALAYLDSVAEPARRSTVFAYLAMIHYYAGDYRRAMELAGESLQIAEQTGDQNGIGFAHNFLGSCAKALGDYTQAQAHFERSVEVYRALEDGLGAAMTVNNLGNLAQATGDYAAAQRYYRECSDLFKFHDHLHGAATTLSNAGRLALRQGEFEQARRLLLESLDLKREMQDRRGVAVALITLGDVYSALGEDALARSHLSEGLALALESGDVRLTLDGLVATAAWAGAQERAAAGRLLAFALTHPALTQEARQRAEGLSFAADANIERGIDPQITIETVVAEACALLAQ